MKFQRTYQLQVQGRPYVFRGQTVQQTYIINYPLTLELNIARNNLAAMNTAHLRIYNLSADVRRALFHTYADNATYQGVLLKAGYVNEPTLPVIFKGSMYTCTSYRHGVNWITDINAWDGGWAVTNAFSNYNYPKYWKTSDVLAGIAGNFGNLTAGGIGAFSDDSDNNTGPLVVAAKTWDKFQELAGSNVRTFIDQETVNALHNDEYLNIPGVLTLINSANGLKETPITDGFLTTAKMVFEPRARVGPLVTLNSVESYLNGQYQVIGVSHDGIISDVENDDLTTSIVLQPGTTILKAVNVPGASVGVEA